MQISIKTHIGQFALDILASVIAEKQADVNSLGLYHLLVHDSASSFYKGFDGKRKDMAFDAKHSPALDKAIRENTKGLFNIESIDISQYVPKTKPAPTLAEQLASLGYSPEQIAEIVKGAKPEAAPIAEPEAIVSES
jgi:hypothetical protein